MRSERPSMDNHFIPICVMLCLCNLYTDGFTVTSLYSTTQSALLGFPFTLVCTWNHTENGHQNALYFQWLSDNGQEFIFNSQSCVLEPMNSGPINISRVSYDYGFQYQSLTINNITASDFGTDWYCSSHGYISKPVIIQKREFEDVRFTGNSHVIYTGSNVTLTCAYLSDTPLFRATWLVDNSRYFVLSESCVFRFKRQDELDIVKRSHPNCSQNSSQSITITNVTMADHDLTWRCYVRGESSNVWRVIVLDPDLPKNVSLSRIKVDLSDNLLILVCSVRCEYTFIFSWDTDGIVSDIAYDSCQHICSQTLTVHVEENDFDQQITCTVTNRRTGKTGSAQYLITQNGDFINPVIIVTPLVIFLILIIAVTVVVYFKFIRPPKRQTTVSNGTANTRNEDVYAHYDNAEVDRGRNALPQDGDHQVYVHYDDADVDNRRDSHPQVGDSQVSRDTRNTYSDLSQYENPDNAQEYGKLHLYGNTSGAGASVQTSNYQNMRVYGNQGDSHEYGKIQSSL